MYRHTFSCTYSWDIGLLFAIKIQQPETSQVYQEFHKCTLLTLCMKQSVVHQLEQHLEVFKSPTHETSNKTMKICGRFMFHMPPC